MNPVLAQSVLNTVFKTADRLGATMPKAATAEHQRLLNASNRRRELFLNLNGNLAGAVVAALENDRDPLRDAGVHEALVAREILNVQRGIEDAIAARTSDLLIQHGPAILEAFREPFDRAAAATVHAVEALGDVDLDDMGGVLARGGTAAKHWAEARQAADTITAIKQTWKLLSAASSTLSVDPRYWPLVIADIPAATFIDEQLGRMNLSAWDAARRGFPLSFASTDTLRERIGAVQVEVQRRQADTEGAFSRGWRQTHGVGAVA